MGKQAQTELFELEKAISGHEGFIDGEDGSESFGRNMIQGTLSWYFMRVFKTLDIFMGQDKVFVIEKHLEDMITMVDQLSSSAS